MASPGVPATCHLPSATILYTLSLKGCPDLFSVFQTNLAVSVTSKLFYLLFFLAITLFHFFTYLMTPHILQILASLLLFLKSFALFPILPPRLIIEKDSFSIYSPILRETNCQKLNCYHVANRKFLLVTSGSNFYGYLFEL